MKRQEGKIKMPGLYWSNHTQKVLHESRIAAAAAAA